jgi:hypothetical protein
MEGFLPCLLFICLIIFQSFSVSNDVGLFRVLLLCFVADLILSAFRISVMDFRELRNNEKHNRKTLNGEMKMMRIMMGQA